MTLDLQRRCACAHKTQAGFSLVEILVGLVIGLLVTLVIMQVFSVFEGQKRSTMGTADAQTNGNIALYNVQRDVQLAGFGAPIFYPANNPLYCAVGSGISPVTIVDGGGVAGASDMVTVHYGSSPSGGFPVIIRASIPIPSADNPKAVRIGVDTNMGCQVNDIALVSSGAPIACNLTTVIGPSDIKMIPVPSTPPDTTHIELKDGTGVAVDNIVSCMGGGWGAFTYAINNNQLERNGVPSVAEIVNIQAQYGISKFPSTNSVEAWVDASGATWGSASITPTDRNRIKAVRVALVARNGLLEKSNVTNTCTTAKGIINNGPCAWDDTNVDAAPKIDLSNNADWQRYRYRVYETIIPIRSMIWAAKAKVLFP